MPKGLGKDGLIVGFTTGMGSYSDPCLSYSFGVY